jgi:hypothetical protein
LSAFVICCATLLVAADCCQAELLALDDFNYSPVGSDLNGQSGGGSFGFSNAWTGNTTFNIGDGSLVSPTGWPVAEGNSMNTVAYFANRDIERTLAEPLGTPGTTIYSSMLIRPEGILGQGYAGGWFGLAFRGDFQTTVGMLFGGGNYGIEISGTYGTSSTQAVVGQTVLLVTRMDFTEGVDTLRLYINPPGTTEPLAPNAILLNNGIESINRISLTGPGAYSFDRLAIGTTWADVVPVPEPGSMALAAIGGVVVVALGRRHRKPSRSSVTG